MPYDATYARYIDHTILKPEATLETVKKFCEQAKQYHFASVCVNPCNVSYVSQLLKDSGVKTCCVIGFPLGATTTEVKVFEAKQALDHGAQEIDMVINIGRLKDGNLDYVSNDIAAVVNVGHQQGALVKVIIETSALTDDEKVTVCRIAKQAKTDFVKTSTGFGSGGATVEDVKLMKQTVGDTVQVKASTGINNRAICDAMLAAGAVRMGTSKGVYIVKDELPPIIKK
jgi:deoxyribose-phosphate aldolase